VPLVLVKYAALERSGQIGIFPNRSWNRAAKLREQESVVRNQ
jgi:uncharacterized membrane protein YcaP (DUF421 family)